MPTGRITQHEIRIDGQKDATERVDRPSYPPISSYAIIGDCHTAALISRERSIDWYCPGQFDAQGLFCRLLDAEIGDLLSLRPLGRSSVYRQYRGPTAVLETTFETGDGTVRPTPET